MNKTNKKEIAESIVDLSMSIAKFIYGDKPNQYIVNRIKEEAEALTELGIDDLDLLAAGAELSNQAMAGNIYIPRTSSSNSLVYYLLGLSNVNPLPRHTYCPKCHMFYWGHKESDACPDCGEKLFEDGYDLPFALLKDDIKRIGFKFDISCSIRKTYSCRDYELRLLLNPLAQLASKLGLEQEEISIRSFDQEEIIKCLNKNYYSRRYLKEKLLKHQAFIGLPTLGSGMLQDYLEEYKVNNFDELVDLICLMHGTKVYDSCEENLIDIPDLAQTFVVTCALLNIPFRFSGLQSLKIKETDRIEALKTELRKLGYILKDENDCSLVWDGTRFEAEKHPIIQTYEDHRMAMAFAPSSFIFPGIRIANPGVVSKSYPGYWKDLTMAGFQIKEIK